MAFTSTDWTINYGAKTVTNDDSATGDNLPSKLGNYTKVGPILDFFQWLAAEFASTTQMDDTYPIQSDTPTVYKWLNGWTFGNANDFKYLDGGSIEDPVGSGTATADSLWANLYSIGSQTTGTQLYMIQNDAEVTPWWISGNIDILVLVKNTGSWIQSDDTGGTPTNGGLWIYAREFGDLYDHNFADLSGGGRNPIGVNTAGDASNNSGELYLSVTSATGFTAGSFVEGQTSGAVGKITKIVSNDIYLDAVRAGIDTGATATFVISETLTEYSDREGQTATGQSTTNDGVTPFTNVVAGWTTITDTFGTISRDLNNGNGSTNYDVEIDLQSTYSPAEGYEWLKFITRYGSTGATYTVNADDGQEYRSANEGTYTEVKTAPFGTLAGTTFYGARGVWLTGYTVADFVLINAAGDTQAPPNYQLVLATHTSLSGTNILVTEIAAALIVKAQYTIASASAGDTSFTLGDGTRVAIDISTTPLSGVIRLDDHRYWYASFSDATNVVTLDSHTTLAAEVGTNTTTIVDDEALFQTWGVEPGWPVRNITAAGVGTVVSVDSETQITTTTIASQTTGDSYELNTAIQAYTTQDCFIPFLDRTADATSESSDNIIYSSSITVRTSVRKYGFKPYDVDTSFESTGLSFSPILTTDPQAT